MPNLLRLHILRRGEKCPPSPRHLFLFVILMLFQICFSSAASVTAHEIQEPDPEKLYKQMLALYQQRKSAEALPLAQQLLQMSIKENGPEAPDTIAMMRYVAQMDTDLGNANEAETLLLQSAAILEKSPVPTRQYARVLGDLSRLYDRQKLDYAKTEFYLKKAIVVLEKIAPPEDPELCTALENAATLYVQQLHYQEALLIDERVLQIREKTGTPTDPLVAQTLVSTGRVYSKLGEYEKSEAYLKRALAILQSVNGPESWGVASALAVMAENESQLGKFADSKEHYLQAKVMFDQLLDKTSPEDGYITAGMADVAAEQKDYAEAESLYLTSVAIFEAQGGKDDVRVGTTLQNLGWMYLNKGDPSKGESALLRALALIEKHFGPGTLQAALVLHNLALAKLKQKEYQAAVKYSLDAASRYESAYGKNDKTVAHELLTISAGYLAQGKCGEADAPSARALEIEAPHQGDDLEDLLVALQVRSDVLQCLGQKDDAAKLKEQMIFLKH